MKIAIDGGDGTVPQSVQFAESTTRPPNPARTEPPNDSTSPTGSATPASANGSGIAPLPPTDSTTDNEIDVKAGDTIWAIYRHLGLFANSNDPDPIIAKNLPATPWLDPSAFGDRPGNPANAVKDMPIGSTVTVLDGKRLDFLSAERSALQSYESMHGKFKLFDSEDRQDAFDSIVAPVQSEIEYATLLTPVPTQADLDRIANAIKQRAPDDVHLASAVEAAAGHVQTELKDWGRTPDQLGQIIADAKAGNTQQLSADIQRQLVAVGQATLDSTGGDAAQAETAMRARVGVYTTYLGAQNSALVGNASNAAEQQLFVNVPAQRIVGAYNTALAKGGKDAAAKAAAAAAHQLRVELDPNAKLPGKVAQIAADPQVQDIMRKIADNIADGVRQFGGETDTMRDTALDFSAAMQSTFDSDDPSIGMSQGKDTVDKMAGYLMDAIDKGETMQGVTMMERGKPLVDWLALGLGKDGSAALPAALAAKGNATGNVFFSKAGYAALAEGIDLYKGMYLDPLQTKAAKLLVPIERGPASNEWGGLQSDSDKDATVQALKNGPLAGDLKDIVNGQTKAMQYYAKFQGVLDRYGNALGGEGYDSPVGTNAWWNSHSNSVKSTIDSFVKGAGLDPAKMQATSVPLTQFWWQSRVATGSMKFFTQQLAKSGLPSSATADDGSQLLNALFGNNKTGGAGIAPRLMSGFMSGLFYGNSLVAASAADSQAPGASPWAKRLWTIDNDGFAALYGTLSVSQMMDFVAPNWKASVFDVTATGAAATPQRKVLEAALAKVMASGMSDGGKQMTSAALKTALSGTGDLAGAAVAWLGLIPQIMEDKTTNPAHDVAYGLAGVADLGTYLARSAIQGAGELGLEDVAGATFAGLTADGWTGVGIVINIGAAGIQFLANQDDIVHQGDSVKQYLEVQGVPNNLADPFARHMMNDHLGATSAGPFLTAYFKAKGKTNADMIDWMKSVKNGDVADQIATFAKEQDIYKHDKSGNAILTSDQLAGFDAFLDQDIGAGGFQPGAKVHP